MPDGEVCTYTANDASVGDLDGDGDFEIVLKWEPSNAKDNSHSGFTGTVFLDAYELDGTRLWRIDLGRNIRAGAHYTQFMVYDLDGDGRAEVTAKTADGTVDGRGHTIGDPLGGLPGGGARTGGRPEGVYRFGTGVPDRVRREDGAALQTVDYVPPCGRLEDWGDNYANRSERYLAAVAYLDGRHPSVVMCRGYYTRSVLAAFDWDGKRLTSRWVFDTDSARWASYAGQGNHNLRVADVDGDGCDEITYGSCAIDHDGRGCTIPVSVMATPCTSRLSTPRPTACKCGIATRTSATEVISAMPRPERSSSVSRLPKTWGVAWRRDIDPTNYGVEMWSSASGGIRNIKARGGLCRATGLPMNMAVWWDGDLLREMLDHETVSKYDWEAKACRPLATFDGCSFNNGSKSNPCLQGDILGDWREEVVVRTADNTALRVYMSPLPTPYRFHTFLEDRPYRLSIVTENVAYNQPTQPGFYFGAELERSGKLFRGYQFGK